MASRRERERARIQRRIRAKLIDSHNPSAPYRAIEVLNTLRTTPDDYIRTLADIPDYCLQNYPDRETIGVREILEVQDELQPNGKIFKKFILGEYRFTPYSIALARIHNIGRALLLLECKPNDKILIFSETRSEWLLAAFAAFRHGITIVTLYATLGEEAIKYGINESQVSIVFTSYDLLSKLEKTLNHTESVRHVIYFPSLVKNQKMTEPKRIDRVQFTSLDEFERQGINSVIDENILKQRPKKTDIAVIMYTSGSTGTPKGVLIRHENIIAAMTGQQERVFPLINSHTDVYIAYLPLAHILELCCEILMFYMGIKIGYSSPQTLTDQSTAIKRGQRGDLQVLRPHIMCCVPTILDRIHKTINDKLNQGNIFRRLFFRAAYNIKVKRIENGLDSPLLNKLLFRRLNEIALGGRVKTMMSGGALLSAETQRFIQVALCVKLFQGYGLTETCAAATIADQFDTSVGRAGYPLVSCEIRLVNWDEGNYKNTDKPNPRGEILIGGRVVAQGYFAGASSENINFREIDGTRYFATGDIGEIFPDGTLKIIDRKKDLVKLRGGEYVSLTKVEMAISKFTIVENCCLYAMATADFTIVLISPNVKHISIYCKRHFGIDEWQTLIDNNEFNEKILQDVQETCRKNGIERFEIPQRVKIVADSWTPETGLVTDAFKLKRKALEQKYKIVIEQLYQNNPQSYSSKEKHINRVAPNS